MRSRLDLISLVIVVLLAAAACDSHKPSRAASPASTQAGRPAGHSTTGTIPANLSPKQRRAQFEQLLGEHALLAIRQMRSPEPARHRSLDSQPHSQLARR